MLSRIILTGTVRVVFVNEVNSGRNYDEPGGTSPLNRVTLGSGDCIAEIT